MQSMEKLQFDVLVIGAGAAGLMAAWEIALTGRSVAIIEAKDRIGGRIFTNRDEVFSLPIELGAEFVHGDLQLTQQLLKKAGAEIYKISGSIWQKKDGQIQEQEDFIEDFSYLQKKFKELEEDIPVSQFLEQYLQGDKYEELRFTLQNYVEGYYAADTNKASIFALYEELTKSSDEQYRVEDGYLQLVNYLEQQCKEKDVQFFLSQPVWQVHWKDSSVEAITEKGNFSASKVLITVPVGVLQSDAITFFPALPQVKQAAQHLGYGDIVKMIFQFEDAFWKDKALTNGKDLHNLNFLFSEEIIPTWWTQHPKKETILTCWLGGPKAAALRMLGVEELTQKALFSLGNIFGIDVIHLHQKVKGVQFYNWSADPHFLGAYSYEVVNGKKYIKALQQPVEQTIFFAGEGLHHGPEIGTVEAALISGRDTAHRLIASF